MPRETKKFMRLTLLQYSLYGSGLEGAPHISEACLGSAGGRFCPRNLQWLSTIYQKKIPVSHLGAAGPSPPHPHPASLPRVLSGPLDVPRVSVSGLTLTSLSAKCFPGFFHLHGQTLPVFHIIMSFGHHEISESVKNIGFIRRFFKKGFHVEISLGNATGRHSFAGLW